MQVNFNKIDQHLYEIKIVADVDYNQILEDLKSANWKKVIPEDGNNQWAVNHIEPEYLSLYTQDFSAFFKSDEFKQSLIDLLMLDKMFLELHPTITAEHLYQNTDMISNWIQTPGAYIDHPFHSDNHTPYAYGMIYFNNVDDPEQSTWFIPWDQGENFWPWQDDLSMAKPMTTGFGHGWLVLSTDYSWHRAMNLTDQPRHSLKLSLDPLR